MACFLHTWMYLYDTCSKAPTEDAEDMSARPEERPGLATWKAIFQFWARWWHNFFMLYQFWYEGLDYGEFSGNSVNGILHKSTKCCEKRHFWWFPIQNSGLSRSDRNAIIGENSSKTMNFFDWFWSTMLQMKLRNLNQKILSTGNEPGKHARTSLTDHCVMICWLFIMAPVSSALIWQKGVSHA